jgi:hypothetical protein
MLGAAIGFRMSIPDRVESAIGTRENTTAATVINFGRSRNVEPRITASMYDSPGVLCWRASRMKITMMMPV